MASRSWEKKLLSNTHHSVARFGSMHSNILILTGQTSSIHPSRHSFSVYLIERDAQNSLRDFYSPNSVQYLHGRFTTPNTPFSLLFDHTSRYTLLFASYGASPPDVPTVVSEKPIATGSIEKHSVQCKGDEKVEGLSSSLLLLSSRMFAQFKNKKLDNCR